jgi:tetratricopeptide (TPR) repeat protein
MKRIKTDSKLSINETNNKVKSQSEVDYLYQMGELIAPIYEEDILSMQLEFNKKYLGNRNSSLFNVILLFISIVFTLLFALPAVKKIEAETNRSPKLKIVGTNKKIFNQEKTQEKIKDTTESAVKALVWNAENFTAISKNKITDTLSERTLQYSYESMEPYVINSLPDKIDEEVSIRLKSKFNIIFIEGLKVANYYKYYFKEGEEISSNINGGNEAKFSNMYDKIFFNNDLFEENNEIPLSEILKQGLKNFSNSKYNQAGYYFSELLKLNKKDVNALFYLAMSKFSSGNFEEAIAYFLKVDEIELNPFDDEAKFYKALSHLKLNQLDESRKIFESIVKEKTFYSNRAKELLNKSHMFQ